MYMAYFRLFMLGTNLKVMDSHNTCLLSCCLLKQNLIAWVLPLILCVEVYSRKLRKCLPLIDPQSLKSLEVKLNLSSAWKIVLGEWKLKSLMCSRGKILMHFAFLYLFTTVFFMSDIFENKAVKWFVFS